MPGNAVVKIGSDSIKTSEFDHWLTVAATSAQQQTGAARQARDPEAAGVHRLHRQQEEDGGQAGQGPAQADRRDLQVAVRAGVHAAARSDHAVPDLLRVDRGRVGRPWRQAVRCRGQEGLRRPAPAELPRRQGLPRLPEELRQRPGGSALPRQGPAAVGQAAGRRSSRAPTRSPTRRSPTTTTRTRSASPPRAARPADHPDQDRGPGQEGQGGLDGGQDFGAVAKKYSIDQATKVDGGELTGVPKGQQEKSLDAATFKAPIGELRGPVKTQFGYYVFKVQKITPSKQQPLSTSKASIKQLLVSQQQQTALDKFVKDFQKKWKDRTECQKGYQTTDCSNAPKPKPSAPAPATHGHAAADRAVDHHPEEVGRVACGGCLSDPAADAAQAVSALDALTRKLRIECPWDREQDERTIVPHTLEEAYELADAAHRRDDAKLLDELGDVLFQVHFLSLLLEERGAGSLAQVAEHVRQKLIRRHPHIFGDGARVADAGEVLANWDAIKSTEADREPGIFGEVPENLPALLYARKVQRRSASSGFDMDEPPYAAVGGDARGAGGRRRSLTRATPPSATCSSRPSTSRASSKSTRSSRCGPRPIGFARASRPPSGSPRPTARTGTTCKRVARSPITRRPDSKKRTETRLP